MSKLWKASGICERALRKIGAFSVNDTAADPEELSEALYWLDLAVAELAGTEQCQWLIPTTLSIALTANTPSYDLSTALGTGNPTDGAGICHTEVSTQDTTVLHGVQLWIVLPESDRETSGRRFDHHAPEPVTFEGGSALVFIGSLLGSSSSIPTFTPLLGAELRLDPGAAVRLEVDPEFEHGVLVDAGDVTLEGVTVEHAQLAYTGVGEATLTLRNAGSTPARMILLGGTPLREEIVMWWNFIGRSHDEIARYRQEWESGSERFGRVDGYIGHDPHGLTRLPAPRLPGTTLKPRVNPDPRARG